MIWARCNKILTDASGMIVNCPSNPCGFYSVFGIKYRQIDNQTLQPLNECSWNYLVAPYHVEDSAITVTLNNWPICIQIEQKSGKVAEKQFVQQIYSGTILALEIEVYNLCCCDIEYQDFKQHFFEHCNQQTPYPDIWQNGALTWEAETCLSDYWLTLFKQLYLMNFNFEIKNFSQFWQISGIWFESNDGGMSVSAAGSMAQQTQGKYSYGNVLRSLFTQGQVKPPQFPPFMSCCLDNSARATVSSASNYFLQNIPTKANYTYVSSNTGSCSDSANLCVNFSYISQPYDNSYGSVDEVRYDIQWCKFQISKTSDTPASATGIQFDIEITDTKQNTGNGNQSSTTTVTTTTANIYFNTDFEDLPLATYVNGLSYISIQPCDQYCNADTQSGITTKSEPQLGASYNENILKETVAIKMIAKNYI